MIELIVILSLQADSCILKKMDSIEYKLDQILQKKNIFIDTQNIKDHGFSNQQLDMDSACYYFSRENPIEFNTNGEGQ